MATPTIPNGEEHFFVIPYEGNGTAQKVGKFVPFTDNGTIANSVIYNRADNPYMYFNKGSITPDSDKKFTFSCWFKLGDIGSYQNTGLFNSNTDGSNGGNVTRYAPLAAFNSDGKMFGYDYDSGGYNWYYSMNPRTFKDISKWYHFVLAIDTTQSTSTDRMKVYIDGDQITSFSSITYPALNQDLYTVMAGGYHILGLGYNAKFDGYLAEVNLVENQMLTPASFGLTDTSTGRWIPKTVSPFPTTTTDIAVTVVSSGGNKFAVDGVTQGTVTLIEGATYKFDQSDSSNATHPLRFSTTSDGTHNSGTEYTTGVTTVGTPGSSGAYTQITVATGAPTLYYYCSSHSGMGGTANTQDQYGTNGFRLKFQDSSSLGDDTSGNTNDFTVANIVASDQTTDSPTQNHATIDSSSASNTSMTFTEANLKVSMNNAYPGNVLGTLAASSGKYYWEVTLSGTGSSANGYATGIGAPEWSGLNSDAGGVSTPFSTFIDSRGYFYHNGGYVSNSTTFTAGDVISIALNLDDSEISYFKNNTIVGSAQPIIENQTYLPLFKNSTGVANLEYSPNFGQKSWNYTPPTGFVALQQDNLPETDRGISGLTWTKDRDATASWMWIDSSRIYANEGVPAALNTNNTNKEYGQVDFADGINKFLKGGFAVATSNNTHSYMNKSGNANINYTWVGNGGTKVTNTTGSITSSVQANTTGGFSIVEYVGTGSSGSVGHGLSAAPEFMIFKDRDNDSTNWRVYHKSLGGITKYQILNTYGYTQTASMWGAPTASAFIIGGSGYEVNESGRNYVAYCWHGVDGFSRFGKYVGNGVADGPFIYLGFKPRWVMFKANNAASWYVFDTIRNPINITNGLNLVAHPNSTAAADYNNVYGADYLSNGIKIRQPTGYGFNYSGVDSYYMAFAEHPFVGDGTNPVTAR